MSPQTGQCLCGETRYIATGKASVGHACHCKDCQRFVGSAFIGVSVSRLDVMGAVRWFKSSDWGERGSCSKCGSALFWRLQNNEGAAVVSIGSLNDSSAIATIEEHYFADAIPNAYDFTGSATRLNREETLAKFTGAAS